MAKFSVIIPVYQVEEYLQECVSSILEQTYQDFEVILVDDGSPDGCPEICDNLQKQDRRIRVIHKENGGLGSARNAGMEIAQGEYLFFLDSDDFVAPNLLEILCKCIEQHESDIIIFRLAPVKNGKILAAIVDSMPLNQSLTVKDTPHLLLVLPATCNKIYRKDLFIQNNIQFPPRAWYEDLRTIPKLLCKAQNIYCIDDVLYYYLQRSGSITNNSNIERNREILDAFDDLISYFNNNVNLECFSELEYLAIYHLFIAASVRIIQIDPKNIMLDEIAQYMDIHFPNFYQNKYLPLLGRNKTLIFKCLYHKQYKIIQLIFKIKTALERLR